MNNNNLQVRDCVYAEWKSILLQEVSEHKLVIGGWHRVLFDLGWGPRLNYLEPDISIIINFWL